MPGGAAVMSGCAGLARPSTKDASAAATFWRSRPRVDVDGRTESGHDGRKATLTVPRWGTVCILTNRAMTMPLTDVAGSHGRARRDGEATLLHPPFRWEAAAHGARGGISTGPVEVAQPDG